MEVLETVVEDAVNRVESNHTPTKKNSKKRRKVRQTPSPAHEAVDFTSHLYFSSNNIYIRPSTICLMIIAEFEYLVSLRRLTFASKLALVKVKSTT